MMLKEEFDPSLLALLRRRVLAQAERNRRLQQFQAELKHTSAALHQVTGMGEDEVNACFESIQREMIFVNDRFFSVPQQFAWTTVVVIFMIIGVWVIFQPW